MQMTTYMQRIRVLQEPLEINFLLTVRTRLLLANYAPTPDAELVKPDRSSGT